MNPLKTFLLILLKWISAWVKSGLVRLGGAFPGVNSWIAPPDRRPSHVDSEWQTKEPLRTYRLGDGAETMVTVQTGTHAFYVDLRRLSECSEYFRALSQSSMRETSESLIHLDHVSSSIFHSLLEFSFCNRFNVPQGELDAHIQVSSYLLAEAFLSRCLSVLADELRPDNCLSYLELAQEICCAGLKTTVLTYLCRNMLELSDVLRCLNNEEKAEVVQMRSQGERLLCSLRKENLTTWKDPETERARRVFTLTGSEGGGVWQPVSELPFRADKWCFTTAVLYNYLYIIGGYRQRVKRGWEFKMASFRFNPLTRAWVTTAPLIKKALQCSGL
ncbi:uncharacterized protein LOC114857745 isoform X2 [Betta splendens]|uniref:Uncharacterized protein LOC114857745 isoform X2 n=1 Tax=Betta splendens TaxID=158456 RepID=A0A9W2XVE2_BETSP|nr:uncharacterized protein LOC114857745 isoform X2 [Betta splendens]